MFDLKLNDIEWESHNLEILKALKTGNDALNSIHQEMGVDEVEKLLADTNEAIEVGFEKTNRCSFIHDAH